MRWLISWYDKWAVWMSKAGTVTRTPQTPFKQGGPVSRVLSLTLSYLDLSRTDGLCPSCFLPSLWEYSYTIGLTGTTPAGINHVTFCSDNCQQPNQRRSQ